MRSMPHMRFILIDSQCADPQAAPRLGKDGTKKGLGYRFHTLVGVLDLSDVGSCEFQSQ